MRPTQQKPALLRDIFFSNRDKHSGTRLRTQQVIARRMKMMCFDIEANRDQLAAAVEQQLKIHFIGKLSRDGGNSSEVGDQAFHIRFCREQSVAKLFVKGLLFARRGIKMPLNLVEQVSDEVWQLLQCNSFHHFEVDAIAVPQRQE